MKSDGKAEKENRRPYEAKGDWWTCPSEGENGGLIMVTGRRDIAKFRDNPRFNIRVEIAWEYGLEGMPALEDGEMMEQVTERLQREFDKDPVAVMTGIFTGEGRRDWIFYTLSTNIFGLKLNEALSDLPALPLKVYCENDPDWAQYDEMRFLSKITASDE